MNFRSELAEKVIAGRKTVTRRLVSANPRSPWFEDRCALRVGCDYAVCPGRGKRALGRVVIRSVRRERLGRLPNYEAIREGFMSTGEFERAFAEINGSYDPDALVWRVAFLPAACEPAQGSA